MSSNHSCLHLTLSTSCELRLRLDNAYNAQSLASKNPYVNSEPTRKQSEPSHTHKASCGASSEDTLQKQWFTIKFWWIEQTFSILTKYMKWCLKGSETYLPKEKLLKGFEVLCLLWVVHSLKMKVFFICLWALLLLRRDRN